MKKFLSVLLVLLCTAISVFAFGVDDTMSKVMDSWKGCHIDQVIDRWGYPTDEKTIAGHKLYIWKTERTVTTDGNSTTKEVYTAERIIEVDDNNIVIKGRWSGNDLPFTFMGVAKDWLNPTYELKKQWQGGQMF